MNIQAPRFRGTYSILATDIMKAYDLNGQGQGALHLDKIRWHAAVHEDTIKRELPENFHLEVGSEKVLNNGRVFPADTVKLQILNPKKRWIVQQQFIVNRHMGEDLGGFWQRLMEEAKSLKETYLPF